MSNNKQSSVDWLHIELQKRFPKETYEMYNNNQLSYEEMIQQAKAMHKEEIVKSNEAGFDDGIGFIEEIKYKNAEDYYNKTFGGNNGHI